MKYWPLLFALPWLAQAETTMEHPRGNTPSNARAEQGIGLFTFCELLIWQAHENGIPLAIRTKNPLVAAGEDFFEPLDLLLDGKVENLPFHWDPGVRLGLGWHTSYDNIDVSLTWLQFFTKTHRHLRAPTGQQLAADQLAPLTSSQVLPMALGSADGFFADVEGSWAAHLNQLDLDLGQTFSIGQRLVTRPHFGLRTTWLKQTLSANHSNNLTFEADEADTPPGDNFDVDQKSFWWGIGPEAGVEGRYYLYKGWNLSAAIATALEYGYHQTARQDIDTNAIAAGFNPFVTDVKDEYWMSHPILDLEIGLGWEKRLASDRLHLHLDLLWENHVYFSQNRFPFFLNETMIGVFTDQLGDKTYQGFTLSAGVDY